ncbi:hypothetical protein [Yunchengibacter salinarum]|uniref:hypothetical protein n=1 Tax=Yunchengibacter salinarum TaxID=3133399 RepID=UPI0035B63A68
MKWLLKRLALVSVLLLAGCGDGASYLSADSDKVQAISAEEFAARLPRLAQEPALMDRPFFRFLSLAATPKQHDRFLSRLDRLPWFGDPVAAHAVAELYPAYYADFLKRESVGLFVYVDGDRSLGDAVRAALLRYLPPHVRLVDHPYGADLEVRFAGLSRDVDLVEKSRKSVSSRYPKKYRKDDLARCQQLLRGHYTLIKQAFRARLRYRLSMSARGALVYDETMRDKASADFRTGADLRAETPCGRRSTTVFPGDNVRRLFDDVAQKQDARFRLDRSIAQDLAFQVGRLPMPLRRDLY